MYVTRTIFLYCRETYSLLWCWTLYFSQVKLPYFYQAATLLRAITSKTLILFTICVPRLKMRLQSWTKWMENYPPPPLLRMRMRKKGSGAGGGGRGLLFHFICLDCSLFVLNGQLLWYGHLA